MNTARYSRLPPPFKKGITLSDAVYNTRGFDMFKGFYQKQMLKFDLAKQMEGSSREGKRVIEEKEKRQ